MPPRLLYIVTVPVTADKFLGGHLAAMREAGFEVTLASSPGPELERVARREQIETIALPMQREISPGSDLVSLWRLSRLLSDLQPNIVNASTPKAGLLGMLAAQFVNVPIRIYMLRGLRLETATGLKRQTLTVTEQISCACAHHVICNSSSLLQQAKALRLAPPHKLRVLGRGSSNGVDSLRFLPKHEGSMQGSEIRQQHGIPLTAKVIGFVGRFTRDKGIVEGITAFAGLDREDVFLLCVGRFEDGDPVPQDVIDIMRCHPRIRHVDFVQDPAPYYQAMDILAFPSYREGFPNVPLEAALSEVPIVGFRATGVIDAVQHNQTGILVPLGSSAALATALAELIDDPMRCQGLGKTARTWALANFTPQDVWRRWAEFYYACLNQ